MPLFIQPGLRLDFPPAPIESSFQAGMLLAKKGFPVDSTEGDEFQPIGFWFDGRIKRPVDHVIWVNADLASRWLGWLATKGEWSHSLVLDRWGKIRERLNGSVTFALALNAFPKLDPLGYGTGKEADPASILRPYCRIDISSPNGMDWGDRNATFWQFDGHQFDSGQFVPQLVWSGEAFSWQRFWNDKFYQGSNLASLFEPNDYRGSDPEDLPLGNFYGAKWLISISTQGLPASINQICFEVIRPGKVAQANFTSRESEHDSVQKHTSEDENDLFGQNE